MREYIIFIFKNLLQNIIFNKERNYYIFIKYCVSISISKNKNNNNSVF